MAKPLTSEYAKLLYKILEDGEWHDREAVISQIGLTVPPGVAFRRGEFFRNRKRETQGPRVRGDDADSIAFGRRQIAYVTVNNHVVLGNIELKDGKIRLTGKRDMPPGLSLDMDKVYSHDLRVEEDHDPSCAKATSQRALWAELKESVAGRQDLIRLMIMRDECDCGADEGE